MTSAASDGNVNYHDLRESLNHLSSKIKTPAKALKVISLVRTAFSSSTSGSVPSPFSASCPCSMPFMFTAELEFCFRLPGTSGFSSPNESPFGSPLDPF